MTTSEPHSAAEETLRLLGPVPDNWVPDRPGIDHNVTIVGGGQSGSAFAFALRRAGIGKVTVIDAAETEALSGVWLTAARMNKLRTPKALPGPELGLPGLGFQAWFEARFGRDAYAAIDRIPRTAWADYLSWYRRTLAIPVRYGTRLQRIEPIAGGFRLHLDIGGERRIETTRKVILANGVAGNGGAHVIAPLSALPASHHAHSAEAIDFSRLAGKTVAVVGSAASAFDAGATALEAGAGAVHLFARRAAIAARPVVRSRGYPGAYDNYPALPDAFRWRQALRYRRAGSTPPPDAIERVVRFPNFHLHLASPVTAARIENGRAVIEAAGESFAADFVISGTGYFVAPVARPELADVADDILLWRDRYQPAPAERDDELGAHPYLGSGLEYLERVPGRAPFLGDIHIYNPAAFVSFGLPVGDVPSLRRDVPAAVARISRDLFLADFDAHQSRIDAQVAPEFDETLYAAALWRRSGQVAAE
jgi:FAD-dependent urate hydroxylase